jgi:hypothetical protein
MSVSTPKCTCGDLRACNTCYQRDWRRRNPDKVARSKARWGRTRRRAGDPAHLAYSAIYRATHPVRNEPDPRKRKARNELAAAIRYGRVARGPCEVCGDPKSQGHHDDYDQPLAVRWLCSRHHADQHRAGA